MYICTFYSFKGGVGRSLALVNIAAQYALSGKRILLVDFDLEAPGLDTFDSLQFSSNTPGIVDYVQKYLKENRVPNIFDYVTQSKFNDHMYLMPSGDPKQNYARKAFQIDWKDLYANRDGYMLFEDMKVQWQKEFQPDYVFIDSRTGYSDTNGICTRHLPDSVVILFFPNDQNLRGVSKVVGDIRSEAYSVRQKNITLHFVMSNVPFLDDEEEIIQEFQQRFADELDFSDCHVIHRYDSLPLLQQSVFVAERPKSRLAKEYQHLSEQISIGNIADRNGALFQIDQFWKQLNNPDKQEDTKSAKQRVIEETNTLLQIQEHFPGDFEILSRLARLWMKGGNLRGSDTNTEDLVSDALHNAQSDHQKANLLVTVAEDSQPEYKASQYALNALDYISDLDTLKRALDCLRGSELFFDIDVLQRISDSVAISNLSLEDKLTLSIYLERNNYLAYSNTILSNIIEPKDSKIETSIVLSLLTRNQIALERYTDAHKYLLRAYSSVQEMSIIDAFNFGIASWGAGIRFNSEPFLYVRDKIEEHYSEDIEVLFVNTWIYDKKLFSTNPDQDFSGDDYSEEELSLWNFNGQDIEGLRLFEEFELAQIYILCCWVIMEAGSSLDQCGLRIYEFGMSNSNRLFNYFQFKYTSFEEFKKDSQKMLESFESGTFEVSGPPFS